MLLATALGTGIELVAGLAAIPSQYGHFGEGAGCFAGDPCLEKVPGALNDLNTFAGSGLGLYGGLNAATARGAAAGEEAAVSGAGEAGAVNPLNGGCFVAGTPIRMADGSTKPVQQVRKGDRVLARDRETGMIAAKYEFSYLQAGGPPRGSVGPSPSSFPRTRQNEGMRHLLNRGPLSPGECLTPAPPPSTGHRRERRPASAPSSRAPPNGRSEGREHVKEQVLNRF